MILEALLFIVFGFCLGQIFAPLFYNKIFGLKFIKEDTVCGLMQSNYDFMKTNDELIKDNNKLMEINESLVDKNELYLSKLEDILKEEQIKLEETLNKERKI